MNNIQIFNSDEFGTVRTLDENGTPYFVGIDVATILGYAKPRNTIANHVDDEDKTTTLIQGSGSNYKTNVVIINESGLYSLILSSKMPIAKKFKHWVTSEILPSLRKHGAYMTTETLEKVMNDPDTWIKVLTALKDERSQKEQLQIEVEASKPKVIFADAVSVSDTIILIRELAKLLKGNGIDIGQNRLFEWLRQKGYLIKKKGTDYNAPTQMAMNLGLFKVEESVIPHTNGQVTVVRTTKVTGKGQQYFINRFLKAKRINRAKTYLQSLPNKTNLKEVLV